MRTNPLAYTFFVLFFSGCVSLNNISTYAGASLTGIKYFNDLNYSFEQNCLDKCRFDSAINRKISPKLNCDCAKSSKADSVNQAIYNVVVSYFSGLAELSDNHETTENIGTLVEKIHTMNWLDDVHSKAVTDISSVLYQAATNNYRRKKLITYIERANAPIQLLLKKLKINLQADLSTSLDRKAKNLTDFFEEPVRDTTVSDFQILTITDDYYRRLNDIDTKRRTILAYCEGLDAIAQGHQKLFDGHAKADSKEIKAMLFQSATDIKFIYSDVKKLKNN